MKQIEPGQYTGAGIAIGAGVGVALGVALGNSALGLPIGVAIGLAIGASMEQKAKKEGRLRELSEEEHRKLNKRRVIAFVFGLIVAGLIIFFVKTG